ncbi:MAG: helix-hairpin-helix domain-containing protein [Flavobacteriaceae bacterium]|nr:helix-hairpin-helix domain-containing protein [Flavobacteriaceae bacterium]
MKNLKPHFWYHKSQRNGVFFLLLLIIMLQLLYAFVDFSTDEEPFNDVKIAQLQKKIDSLKIIAKEKRTPKLYPFNPNYLTDYKASQIGMSVDEIDRLIAYRKQNKFINSKEDFKTVTKVSDSLLDKIAPYFKFPDWVVKQQEKRESIVSKSINNKYKITTTDINLATVKDFETVVGVNEYLAIRIVKYRSRLQGFTYKNQLNEVWKLNQQTVNSILATFKIKTKPIIKKVNVNTATFKEVLSNPYIDYELCKKIFNFRDEVAELQSIEELKKIQGFPLDKYDRIILYLEAK